jgi:hypothetical protein
VPLDAAAAEGQVSVKLLAVMLVGSIALLKAAVMTAVLVATFVAPGNGETTVTVGGVVVVATLPTPGVPKMGACPPPPQADTKPVTAMAVSQRHPWEIHVVCFIGLPLQWMPQSGKAET